MRLICPNCDAQYEVPDDVIPTSGRDVQCSNCGQTWFQHHPDNMPDEDDALAASEALPEDIPDPDEEVAPPPPPTPPEPPSRQLDPAVADILRQEAEAEHEARKRRQQADQDPLESQPELGIDQAPMRDVTPEDAPELAEMQEAPDDPELRSSQARSRMARMRGETVTDVSGNGVPASRRELLPDIEEINSTLRSEDRQDGGLDQESAAAEPAVAGRSGGFRSGFLVVVVLFALATIVYLFAPQISNAVPALDPLLNSYVTGVDELRMWLDAQARSAGTWLDDKAAQSTNQ